MPVLDGLEIRLEVDDVLRGQGADPAVVRSRSPRLVETAGRALEEGRPLLAPAVLYEQFTVESLCHQELRFSGGGRLGGAPVAEHLGRVEKVIAAVCTIGAALEKHASQVMAREPVYGLALDGVGAAAIDALANAACRRFAEWAAAEGLQTSAPLSPGTAGWPLDEGQRQLFALLDPGRIGVALSEHSLMLPWKSVSMVLGVGRHVEHTGRSCDYCSLRDTCRYRSVDA